MTELSFRLCAEARTRAYPHTDTPEMGRVGTHTYTRADIIPKSTACAPLGALKSL